VDLRDSADDRAFRDEVRGFLEESLAGEFAPVRGRGGPGDEHALFDERLAWERHLGAHGWTCVAWPKEHGGRGLSLRQQVIYHEEYARAGGPGRLGHIGEGLVGPTLMAFGSAEQQQRFLPAIAAGEDLWCQGYSEPDAGSDLANLKTRAERDGDDWVITGQKVWTSLAHWADWCFVLARTSPVGEPEPERTRWRGPSGPAEPRAGSTFRRHAGISYLLVPMRQEGIEIRPIVQITGDSEFNEVFFAGARTAVDNVVGDVGDGWRVAMGTLGFERGASTLGQQLNFRSELDAIVELARRADPVVRQRLAQAHIELTLMGLNALRATPGTDVINKLYWANLHRSLGELAADVLGADALVDPDGRLQRLFLFTRADTIYGGSDEIQRNIIGERALGLPKEPR
jgi:alkylation response protein AidB-like acyl-CoA dehydrogenase